MPNCFLYLNINEIVICSHWNYPNQLKEAFKDRTESAGLYYAVNHLSGNVEALLIIYDIFMENALKTKENPSVINRLNGFFSSFSYSFYSVLISIA